MRDWWKLHLYRESGICKASIEKYLYQWTTASCIPHKHKRYRLVTTDINFHHVLFVIHLMQKTLYKCSNLFNATQSVSKPLINATKVTWSADIAHVVNYSMKLTAWLEHAVSIWCLMKSFRDLLSTQRNHVIKSYDHAIIFLS